MALEVQVSSQNLWKLRHPMTGLYGAALALQYQLIAWLRDNAIMGIARLAEGDHPESRSLGYAFLNIALRYERKIDFCLAEGYPGGGYKLFHPRYWKDNGDEIWCEEWGYAQSDAVAAILAYICLCQIITPNFFRSDHDWRIVQKLVWYLQLVGLYPDHGIWENGDPIARRLSSLSPQAGALILAGAIGLGVDSRYKEGLARALWQLWPQEFRGRSYDIAKLLAVWPWGNFIAQPPFNITREMQRNMLHELMVEAWRLNFIRYESDKYNLCGGRPPSWTPFAFGLAGLAYASLGNRSVASDYLVRLESTATMHGLFCESHCQQGCCYNFPGLGMPTAFHVILRRHLEGNCHIDI